MLTFQVPPAGVLVNVVQVPTHTLDPPSSVDGSAFTVITAVRRQPDDNE